MTPHARKLLQEDNEPNDVLLGTSWNSRHWTKSARLHNMFSKPIDWTCEQDNHKLFKVCPLLFLPSKSADNKMLKVLPIPFKPALERQNTEMASLSSRKCIVCIVCLQTYKTPGLAPVRVDKTLINLYIIDPGLTSSSWLSRSNRQRWAFYQKTIAPSPPG